MAMTGTLSHIDISAGHPDRSIPFYDTFFRALGYQRWANTEPDWQEPDPKRAAWWIQTGEGGVFAVEVRPAHASSRDCRYDRYAPGPHHIAFNAESHDVVDEVHRAMTLIGAEVLDPPTEYGGQAGYGKAYYAVFFADPDGQKLEVVCLPEETP